MDEELFGVKAIRALEHPKLFLRGIASTSGASSPCLIRGSLFDWLIGMTPANGLKFIPFLTFLGNKGDCDSSRILSEDLEGYPGEEGYGNESFSEETCKKNHIRSDL